MKKIDAIAVAVSVSLLGAFTPLNAQTRKGNSGAVAAITQLENENAKASLGNPREFLQKNLADDFVGGTSFGKWETKADMLKDTENPENKTKSMSVSDLKVSAYGTTGIARYTLAYDDMHNGEHRARTVFCTDTWIEKSGAWKEVASHCSQTK